MSCSPSRSSGRPPARAPVGAHPVSVQGRAAQLGGGRRRSRTPPRGRRGRPARRLATQSPRPCVGQRGRPRRRRETGRSSAGTSTSSSRSRRGRPAPPPSRRPSAPRRPKGRLSSSSLASTTTDPAGGQLGQAHDDRAGRHGRASPLVALLGRREANASAGPRARGARRGAPAGAPTARRARSAAPARHAGLGGEDRARQRARAGPGLDDDEAGRPARCLPPGVNARATTAPNSGPTSGLVRKSPRPAGATAGRVEAALRVVERLLDHLLERDRPRRSISARTAASAGVHRRSSTTGRSSTSRAPPSGDRSIRSSPPSGLGGRAGDVETEPRRSAGAGAPVEHGHRVRDAGPAVVDGEPHAVARRLDRH